MLTQKKIYKYKKNERKRTKTYQLLKKLEEKLKEKKKEAFVFCYLSR